MITIDGVDLNDPSGRWELDSETSLRQMGEISSTLVNLPGRDGATRVGPLTVGAATRQIVVCVRGDDYGQMMRNRAILDALFTRRTGLLVMRETLPGGPTLEASCELVSMSPKDYGVWDLSETLVTYTVRIPSGVYRELDAVTAQIVEGEQTVEALIGGSARQMFPTLIVTPASIGDFHVRVSPKEDPLAWIRVGGSADNTNPINVDTALLSVTQGQNPKQGLLDAGPHPFFIPADGKLWANLNNCSVTVTSRKAWY